MRDLHRSAASWVLLGIFLMPSPRILDPDRTHKRHATCEHHLRRHHPDPADRARILRRAARRQQRIDEEHARVDQARLHVEQDRLEHGADGVIAAPPTAADREEAEATAQVAAALDESNLQPCQAAADPQDDDSRMKKGRRPAKAKRLFWSLQEPPKIRPAGNFLEMLRAQVRIGREDTTGPAEAQAHYGSGPCHSIPRPREGTTLPAPPLPGAVAL